MNNEKWHEVTIINAELIHRDTRLAGVRRFFHTLMPSFVRAPRRITELHTSRGKVLKLDAIAPSAEGVRYAGSNLPLPAEQPTPQAD